MDLTGLGVCREIENDTDRLSCFDQAVRSLCQSSTLPCDPGSGAESAPDRQKYRKNVASTPAAGAEEKEKISDADFGLREAKKRPSVRSVNSRLMAVNRAAYGKQVFRLENGQVWVENEPGRRKVRADYQKVSIKKKGLRYLLYVESGPVIAVHRLE